MARELTEITARATSLNPFDFISADNASLFVLNSTIYHQQH